MSYEIPVFDLGTHKAGADLSAAANQYKIVKQDANGDIVLCSAVTDLPLGVLQNKPKLGEAAIVRVVGVTKIQADAALAIGAQLSTSADAQAKAASVAAGSTEYILARALEAAAAAGEVIAALLTHSGPQNGATT